MLKIIKYRNYLCIFAALGVLTSCGSPINFKLATIGLSAASQGFFSRPDVNLKEKNHAAADYLAVKMKNHINGGHIILAKPLEEMDNAGISSPLGAYIPEGVGLRFIELGYQVQLHEVAANGNAGLYNAPPSGQSEDFILKGSYKHGQNAMDISLRLIDARSNNVVASFDYSLLLSKEVRELSKTEVKIFRVK